MKLVGLWVSVLSLAAACADGSPIRNANGDVLLRETGCKNCRVVVDSIALLGHPDDTLAMGDEVPARDSRGRFYVAQSGTGVVMVFGPNGRLMTRFGKPGNGPGEFGTISEIFPTAGDTLLVTGAGVIHVISPTYVHVRQYTNSTGSGGIEGTMLLDNRLLVQSGANEFTLLDAQGGVSSRVKLAGLDSSVGQCGECGSRVYREAVNGGSVWSGPTSAYHLDNHDLSGKLLQRLIREVSWFPTWPRIQPPFTDEIMDMARPRLQGVRQDSDGILWTHVWGIENPELFEKGIDPMSPRGLSKAIALATTRIEAVDPTRGVLLAGTTLAQIVVPLTGNYSAQLLVDDSGDWVWKIVRFRIERR